MREGVTHLKVVSRGNTTPDAQPSIVCVSPGRESVDFLSVRTTSYSIGLGWRSLQPHRFFLLSDSESHGLVQSHIRIKAFLRQPPALGFLRPLAPVRAPEMIPYQPWSTRWPPSVADQIPWFVSRDRRRPSNPSAAPGMGDSVTCFQARWCSALDPDPGPIRPAGSQPQPPAPGSRIRIERSIQTTASDQTPPPRA